MVRIRFCMFLHVLEWFGGSGVVWARFCMLEGGLAKFGVVWGGLGSFLGVVWACVKLSAGFKLVALVAIPPPRPPPPFLPRSAKPWQFLIIIALMCFSAEADKPSTQQASYHNDP